MMLTKLSPLLIRLSKFLCVIFLFFTPLFIFPPASYSQNFQDDYHSLRPYPFEPLHPDVTGVIQCGNTVYAIGSITGLGVCGPDQCCSRTFTGRYSGIVTIDFANSELPIVGNTEDVANWDVPTDTLSDVEKVNQYVSWYLNGVINRAEYSYLDMSKDCIGETTQKAGVCLNTEPILGLCLSPNPVSPLLPPIPNLLLQADGKNSCGGGKKSCCVTRNPLAREVDILDRDKLINFSGPIRKLLPQRIQDDSREKQVNEVLTERHNQIVACTYGLTIPLTNIQIGAIPGPCYPVASWLNKILELAGIIEPRRLDIWDNHLPPKREEFPEFKDYYKEYRRWRGDTCLSFEIPFLGGIELMLCFDNPAKPNFYGDLYPYIPFTSTEDRGGLAMKEVPTDISGGEKDLVLTNIKYNTNDLNLFYAHMQETVELSDLLKKSYVPKGGTGGEGETTPVEVKEGCQILNIRTNAGDHLVDPDWLFGFTQITGALSFDYKFTCNICGLAGTCTVNPVIPISLSTQNPLHDELWHNLVEGADSVFRRIFPKTGSNTPVTAPKDIPGMTTFETSSNKYTVATGGEIYFPHLGGISEYFLKAIQTALRPKGYGEPFDRGGDIAEGCLIPGHAGKTPPLPGGTGACAIKNNTLNLPDNLIKAIETAATFYGVPPSLMVGIMYGESAFNSGSQFLDAAFIDNQFKECVKLPGCDPNASVIKNIVRFSSQDWESLKDAVKIVDSEREPNACNLLDGMFALAKNLRQMQNGSSTFSGLKCFGIPLNSGGGGSSSCSWDESDTETAIRVWEFGTGYDNTTLSCATKENSCLLGGGFAAQCPTGGDTCETKGNRYAKPSHNGCIWDVYKNN